MEFAGATARRTRLPLRRSAAIVDRYNRPRPEEELPCGVPGEQGPQPVAAGDVVTLDYADDPGAALPRDWDHIGALVADDGDGVLSPGDTLRHMGPAGLEDTPLVHAGPMRIVLWRWRAPARTPRGR